MKTDTEFYAHCDRALRSGIPLLGAWRARQAVAALAERVAEPEALALLVSALAHRHRKVRTAGDQALRSLKQPSAATDALCAAAAREPGGAAARLAAECGFRPSEPGEAAVFLVATGQIGEHFQEHDGLRDLRMGYRRAEAAIQARVMEAARTGDARLVEFVLNPRLSLRECPDAEIAEIVQTSARRQDWARLFTDCRRLPLRHALPGWQALAQSGWQAPQAHDAALVQLTAGELNGHAAPLAPPQPPQGTSAVFEKWLAQGREAELARLDEASLLQRLGQAAPPEAVPIVSALAARGAVSEATQKLVRESEHWLIRLAGYVTGLTRETGLESAAAKDGNFWVRELCGADATWTFWPEDATPNHLKLLDAVPREALMGEAGRARRILRAVLAHGVTGLELEKDTVAPTEGAIEITKIEKKPRKK